jgi:hypothetical protein
MVIGDHGGEIMTGTDCLQMRDLREEKLLGNVLGSS